MFLVRNESPSRGVGCSPGSRSSGSKLSQTPLFLNCQVPMLFFMSYKFICFFYLFMLKLMIVVSVFLRVHNPSAWKLKKFTSFWHLNVGMILIRQCVQTMLLLIIDFTPPLYYVLHLFLGGIPMIWWLHSVAAANVGFTDMVVDRNTVPLCW